MAAVIELRDVTPFARVVPGDRNAIVFLEIAFFGAGAFALILGLRFGLDVLVAASVDTLRRRSAFFGALGLLFLSLLSTHDRQIVKKLRLLVQ